MKNKKVILYTLLAFILLVSIFIYKNVREENSNKYEEPVNPSEYTISDGKNIREVNKDAFIKNPFDGGGTREEADRNVIYTYGEKCIVTLKTDKGESIQYLSTTKLGDTTSRDIAVGDSLDKLLSAYTTDELIFQPTWENYHLGSSKYDEVYKFASLTDDRQIIYTLNDKKIIMIQIASGQDINNTRLELE